MLVTWTYVPARACEQRRTQSGVRAESLRFRLKQGVGRRHQDRGAACNAALKPWHCQVPMKACWLMRANNEEDMQQHTASAAHSESVSLKESGRRGGVSPTMLSRCSRWPAAHAAMICPRTSYTGGASTSLPSVTVASTLTTLPAEIVTGREASSGSTVCQWLFWGSPSAPRDSTIISPAGSRTSRGQQAMPDTDDAAPLATDRASSSRAPSRFSSS
mmetsp:Transcript_53155/g.137490  ORF Transcript_53155/g.137490 Transcript_53155/m.137490 type:complete len:217 (+) Transcript_53155:230-880(+)